MDFKLKLDKKKHLILGCIIYSSFHHFDPEFALLFTHSFGVGKELIWDKYLGKGTPEYSDYLYTVIIPTILYIITKLI
jgi:hypothetical protein